MDNPEGQGGDPPPAKKQKTDPTPLGSLFMPASANPIPSASTVIFDPAGDLHLQVGFMHSFQVDSHSLCRHSSVFKAMLTGPWLESRPAEGKWIVKLPEDSPRGLEVLLNIVHGRFDLVPKTLANDHLFDVCVEADKRDMIKTLGPWTANWILNVRNNQDYCFLKTVFIAWVLGMKKLFTELVTYLLWNCYIQKNGSIRVHLNLVGCDSQLVILQHSIPGFSYAKSTGFLDQIPELRKVCMESLLHFAHRYWLKFATASPVQDFPREHVIIFGWFVSGVRKLDLYALPASMVLAKEHTIKELHAGLQIIPDQIETPHRGTARLHQSCVDAAASLRQELAVLIASFPGVLTEPQLKHLEERAKLLGISDS
ncbi:uncharacterized protein PgNI_00586 [Pyricularia grisea]|uniref:BTB domain-containing protein n=1 Tax=Pyricularia grisea TaxID=148305 RepID=A0A6P8BFK6_PYRGI|nr:uncharacterized protein PgNI_00586 [Pyricularia grisea]TLD15578.1 hypothetical protein PgNI_00586 [Pyricularia grisea]